MAQTNVFPLLSQTASATMTLEIAATETAKTDRYVVDSRTVLINAQGADAAPTYTVDIDAPVGLVFFVDITSFNSNSEDNPAAAVIFRKAGSTVTFDADTEAACIWVTDAGLVDGTNILGSALGATSGATFA